MSALPLMTVLENLELEAILSNTITTDNLKIPTSK
jgi:hypothetical protein